MSSVNYSLNHRGVRLVPAEDAWEQGKNKRYRLSSKYTFVGKIEMTMPNMIVTVSDKKKPKFKGNTYDLNRTAKAQIVEHFYDDRGKRNKKTVAYFGIPREPPKGQKGG